MLKGIGLTVVSAIKIGVFCIALFLSACDKETPILFSGTATVMNGSVMRLDDEGIYIHAQTGLSSDYEEGDRMVVYFHILETMPLGSAYSFEVEVVNTTPISVAPLQIINDNPADTLYNDPVAAIQRMWLSNDYLTNDFTYYATDPKLHSFDLVYKVEDNKPNSDTIKLIFRHETGVDTVGSKVQNLLSFNIGALKPLGKDSVVLEVKTKVVSKGTTTTTISSVTKYFIYR